MPVNALISPRRALAYIPLTSRCSHTSSGVSTNTPTMPWRVALGQDLGDFGSSEPRWQRLTVVQIVFTYLAARDRSDASLAPDLGGLLVAFFLWEIHQFVEGHERYAQFAAIAFE